MAEQNLQQLRAQFGNIFFREIHKNAWLKRITTSSIKKKKEKLWVVFCVHDDTDAFLETYIDNKIAVLHKPDWFVYLNDIQHISPTICPHEQEYEFVLTLKTEVIRLTAPTWEQMLDWVASLQQKLHELRILTPKDNVYTKSPEFRTPLLPTRDPNSPLPPPPVPHSELVPGIEAISLESQNISPSNPSPVYIHRNLNRSLSQNDTPAMQPQMEEETAALHIPQVFNFDNLSESIETSQTEISTSNCHYERLFHLQSDPGPSTRQLESFTSNSSSNLQHPPQPYKTFREQQVLQLQKEMKHSSGIRLQLRKKDCISSIALVDAFHSVWVCGWKQREHPCLYNALHIGDKVVSISGIPIKSAAEAYQLLQSRYCGLYVDIIIKRLPYGEIYLIHREIEGQSLGIIQENNTAVIESVEEDSLAARQGLSSKVKTCDGLSLTNWVLTEINGRPLNLFFKKNQVKDRLNSVGRDISILVQPLDLVKQIKKELKTIKNYKDYLLQ